jgi:RHS repeat-associated protein
LPSELLLSQTSYVPRNCQTLRRAEAIACVRLKRQEAVQSLGFASVTDTYDYDGWGNTVNVTGSTLNSYLYRAEDYDPDLTLYYRRARYFNPVTGRFLARDTEPARIFSPASFHRYLYTSANPVNEIDPRGRANARDAAILEFPSITFGGYLSAAAQGAAAGVGVFASIWCIDSWVGGYLELGAWIDNGALGTFPPESAAAMAYNGLMAGPIRTLSRACRPKYQRNEDGNRCGPNRHDHHMIPQQLRPIVNPIISPLTIDDDRFIFCCKKDLHLEGLHGGSGAGGDWNAFWRQCINTLPGQPLTPSHIFACVQETARAFRDIVGRCQPLLWLKARGEL